MNCTVCWFPAVPSFSAVRAQGATRVPRPCGCCCCCGCPKPAHSAACPPLAPHVARVGQRRSSSCARCAGCRHARSRAVEFCAVPTSEAPKRRRGRCPKGRRARSAEGGRLCTERRRLCPEGRCLRPEGWSGRLPEGAAPERRLLAHPQRSKGSAAGAKGWLGRLRAQGIGGRSRAAQDRPSHAQRSSSCAGHICSAPRRARRQMPVCWRRRLGQGSAQTPVACSVSLGPLCRLLQQRAEGRGGVQGW